MRMEYAIQLLLPILGGLLLGSWLHRTFGLSDIWTMLLAVLGLAAGIAILYKKQMMGHNPLPKITLPEPKRGGDAAKKTGKPGQTDSALPEKQSLSHEELLDLYKKADREPPTDDFALDDLLGDDEGPDDPKKNN
jgi:hypothetical protein